MLISFRLREALLNIVCVRDIVKNLIDVATAVVEFIFSSQGVFRAFGCVVGKGGVLLKRQGIGAVAGRAQSFDGDAMSLHQLFFCELQSLIQLRDNSLEHFDAVAVDRVG